MNLVFLNFRRRLGSESSSSCSKQALLLFLYSILKYGSSFSKPLWLYCFYISLLYNLSLVWRPGLKRSPGGSVLRFHEVPCFRHLRLTVGFPSGASGKEPACQCRRPETWVQSLSQKDALEEGMTTHSSILA